ncbi:MAG: P-loop NTPase [Deltaproteobacteria bacterium]|nr:P-loop NTPase [Deltaproteobacteria bacterium]
MSARSLSLWCFCSVKGGVGKSALAVVCAKLLAARGRGVVLVDGDMTGSSLADGLLLVAPKVAQGAGGAIDLEAPPTGEFHDSKETRRLRAARRDGAWSGQPPPPPFLNDVLAHLQTAKGKPRVDALLWRHEHDDGVRYLPSSSLRGDVARSLEWLMPSSFDWVQALAWAVDGLVERLGMLTDVVVDLPPGVWGFAHQMLVLASMLQRGQPLPEGFPGWNDGACTWTARPFLVLTPHRGDLLPAREYVARYVHDERRIEDIVPIINRSSEPINETQEAARELLLPALGSLGIEKPLRRVDFLRSLDKLFIDQDLAMDQDVRALAGVLGMAEAEPP